MHKNKLGKLPGSMSGLKRLSNIRHLKRDFDSVQWGNHVTEFSSCTCNAIYLKCQLKESKSFRVRTVIILVKLKTKHRFHFQSTSKNVWAKTVTQEERNNSSKFLSMVEMCFAFKFVHLLILWLCIVKFKHLSSFFH